MRKHFLIFINRVFNRTIKQPKLEVSITIRQTNEPCLSTTKEDYILLKDIRLYGLFYTVRCKAVKFQDIGNGCFTVTF